MDLFLYQVTDNQYKVVRLFGPRIYSDDMSWVSQFFLFYLFRWYTKWTVRLDQFWNITHKYYVHALLNAMDYG